MVLKDVAETAAWDQRPAFTDEQLRVYWAELRGSRDAPAYWVSLLMLACGVRTEEAAKLEACDVRPEEGVYVLDINRRVGRLKTIMLASCMHEHPNHHP